MRQRKASQLNTAAVQKDRMAAVKSREVVRGGAPEVRIPPLDAQPMMDKNGRPMTMDQQAMALRDPTNPLSPYYDPQQAMMAQQVQEDVMNPQVRRTMNQPPQNPQNPQQSPQQSHFGRILPKEAEQDPAFIPGVGSRYAVNQPVLQKKQQGQKGKISPETAVGIKALAEFQETVKEVQEETVKPEKEGTDEFNDPEGLRSAMESVGLNEQFFKDMHDQTNKYNLNDSKLRQEIEKRCAPLNVVDLLLNGELRQDVPIVRDQFVPTYRTVSGAEDLEIKRLIYGVAGSDQYVSDLISFYGLTCGLYAINGEPLPDHLDKDHQFDKDMFLKKFERIRSFALAMIGSLSVNYVWFEDRARGLFYDVDKIKNG
jgi:hypothetical protein